MSINCRHFIDIAKDVLENPMRCNFTNFTKLWKAQLTSTHQFSPEFKNILAEGRIGILHINPKSLRLKLNAINDESRFKEVYSTALN